jgi:cytochrome c oxidase assembly protein subunit 15
VSRVDSIARRALAPLTGLLLFLQAALVVTGGAVRLTGSGLGCPTWPECTPGSYTPVPHQVEGQLHAWIEFGNRLLTFALFFAAIATIVAVFRSHRRDLRFLALTQILGILAQGVLGGITVLTNLNPLAVASHFVLSIFLIAAATSLHSRRNNPYVRTSSPHVRISQFSFLHLLLSFAVIVVGTLVTGSGPHAGDLKAPRLDLNIQHIAYLHGGLVALLLLLTIAFYFQGDHRYETKRWLTIFFLLALAQGAIGYIQYIQGVPELLVGTHLLGSSLVWIATWRVRLSVVRKPA